MNLSWWCRTRKRKVHRTRRLFGRIEARLISIDVGKRKRWRERERKEISK